MRKYYILFVTGLIMLMASCQPQKDVIVNVDIAEMGDYPVSLFHHDMEIEGKDIGNGILQFVIADLSQPAFLNLKMERFGKELFVVPGSNLNVAPHKNHPKRHIGIEAKGDFATACVYLSERPNYRMDAVRIKKDTDFFTVLDQFVQDRKDEMSEYQLDPRFVEIELERIRLNASISIEGYYKFSKYRNSSFRFSDETVSRLKGMLSEKESYSYLAEYRRLADMLATILSKNVGEPDPHAEILNCVRFIISQFKGEEIRNSMVHKFSSQYIKDYSTTRAEELIGIYNKHVGDDQLQTEFNALVKEESRLAKGSPSPEFSYPDINGKMVSLSDFRGKAVYIDMWATWCGPCCAEIPYLKNLEKEYHDKNIVFVSISKDKDQEKWRNMVEGSQMTGVQLNFDGNNDFSEAYGIKSIPRFILIDSKGNIFDSNCIRPSHSNIREVLDAAINS